MSPFRLLFAEILFRKLNFTSSLLAVTIAVVLFVAGPMLVDGYQQETRKQVGLWDEQVEKMEAGIRDLKTAVAAHEKQTEKELAELEGTTRRLMRDLGFNLMIVDENTQMADFWEADFAKTDMPEQYVRKLAADPKLTLITHLVATLQARYTWEKRSVLLVGYLPEVAQAHGEGKKAMGYNIPPGSVFLGHELGLGREVGQSIELGGKSFRIARILPEQGSKEDITLALHLSDAQTLLDKPGRITQIMALGCHCAGSSLASVRQQLKTVLPGTKITEFRTLALARAEQRDHVVAAQGKILAEMKDSLREREAILRDRKESLAANAATRQRIQQVMETLAAAITPLVALAAAVWVGLLALANVRQRRTEIGLLRALGKGSGMIAGLFLGKAMLLGLAGAAAGFFLGTWLAQWLGVQALGLDSGRLALRPDILVYSLAGAPLLSALATYLPTLTALAQDPAVVLRDG